MSLRTMCMLHVDLFKNTHLCWMYVCEGEYMPLHACGGQRTFSSLFFPSSLGRREQHKFSGLHDKCFNSLSRLLGPIRLYSFYDLAELPFCL